MKKANSDYITLKEASKISGYTPDYIGQLIRGGKLHGRQVYQNITWMTTESDLRAYMEAKKLGDVPVSRRGSSDMAPDKFASLLRPLMYVALLLLVVLLVVLLYIFSSSLERSLDVRALQSAQQQSL